MKINLPITQHNYDYPGDELLVSSTNTRGEITHCNPAFVRVSGYSYEELIGQPHNIIRHPDVPAAAFKDMWSTVGRGKPWTGLVKNRRKNGDHYWVRANVTPILEGHKPVGYLSVRTKPTAQEVQQAEALFAQMRREAEQGRTSVFLREGRLLYTGPRGWLQRARALGLTVRMALTVGALSASVLMADVLGLQGWQALAWRVVALVLVGSGMVLYCRYNFVAALKEAERFASDLSGCNLTTSARTDFPSTLGVVMRRLGTAQALRTRLVPKAPQPWVDALLLSALSLACGRRRTRAAGRRSARRHPAPTRHPGRNRAGAARARRGAARWAGVGPARRPAPGRRQATDRPRSGGRGRRPCCRGAGWRAASWAAVPGWPSGWPASARANLSAGA